ncbi:uncharacterized protein LOC107824512 isoform X2 [Nicotiana tabacum]|uniref:Uncharacterized protein LOC107824512 isoform X2 n=1 Tax=Nicotiana tabacum TaxID=4097 RepID=A0A1S4D025_TOBAC|nr:PREDICTED: uncharacterized protein LOC107824512 isoform X2 [Nicotiana tabacum]
MRFYPPLLANIEASMSSAIDIVRQEMQAEMDRKLQEEREQMAAELRRNMEIELERKLAEERQHANAEADKRISLEVEKKIQEQFASFLTRMQQQQVQHEVSSMTPLMLCDQDRNRSTDKGGCWYLMSITTGTRHLNSGIVQGWCRARSSYKALNILSFLGYVYA